MNEFELEQNFTPKEENTFASRDLDEDERLALRNTLLDVLNGEDTPSLSSI